MAGAAVNLQTVLPVWLQRVQLSLPRLGSDDQRMAFAIELAGRNVDQGTGGPFGAIVVESQSGQLVSAGVNVVTSSGMCTAHAEMVAIGLANQSRGTYDLGAGPALELVSSVEPCAMCLGALVWSGVRRLVCGSRSSAATAVGFDEGPRASDWVSSLQTRGIDVVRDVRADEAAQVLVRYAEGGGPIYNPQR
jgi:tRNA(Arg) A34 adenosine deaminase TadA